MNMTASEKLRAPRPTAAGHGAAFFDLDGTLIPGSANIPLALAAFRAGMVTPQELVQDLRHGVSFLLQGATDQRSEAVRDRILAAVAGRPADEVIALSEHFLVDLVDSITPAMRDVLEHHATAGRDRIVLSASPTEIVSRLADAAGLELGTGTSSEIDAEGRYTGALAGPFCYREGKAEILRALAAEHGYDLAASYAYTDSVSDLPMLEAVGHPVAVNPEPELRALAEERGWPIVETSRLPRVSLAHPSSWARMGRRLVAGTVGAVVSRGTRPVEEVDSYHGAESDPTAFDLLTGETVIGTAVAADPRTAHLRTEDLVQAHGRA
jgi:HAD superfamily hydrolase (TIGR01490 family)